MSIKSFLLIPAVAALTGLGTAHADPVIITGVEVSGTTHSITLTAGNITRNNMSLSNSGGNLVVNFDASPPNGDFFMQWDGAGDDLAFNTALYPYVQVDIATVSAGMQASQWQQFWEDDDSGIGGGNNSSTNIGVVTPQAQPFSFVVDLTAGGSSTSGATGWGPGTLDRFRFDPFQGIGNAGESFEISAITFGSAITVIPEPSTALLMALGLAGLALRRRH